MSKLLELGDGKLSELSACARAMVDVIRLKRDMRGCPDPRPVDVTDRRRSKRQAQAAVNWADPTVLPPAKASGSGPAPQ